LDAVLEREHEPIAALLNDYGVPRVARPGDLAGAE
jgi:hypothetical protein